MLPLFIINLSIFYVGVIIIIINQEQAIEALWAQQVKSKDRDRKREKERETGRYSVRVRERVRDGEGEGEGQVEIKLEMGCQNVTAGAFVFT